MVGKLLCLVLLFVSITAYAAEDIVVTISPSAEQEGVFGILINRECARLLASGEATPGFCTINSPAPGQCTCTPNQTQKAAAIRKLYVDDQFRADRQQLYRDYAEELARWYVSAPKAARDVCDAQVPRPGLP